MLDARYVDVYEPSSTSTLSRVSRTPCRSSRAALGREGSALLARGRNQRYALHARGPADVETSRDDAVGKFGLLVLPLRRPVHRR